MGHVDWIPCSEMPEALKDGRRVLLARHAGELGWLIEVGRYQVGQWFGSGNNFHPTHVAEINEP